MESLRPQPTRQRGLYRLGCGGPMGAGRPEQAFSCFIWYFSGTLQPLPCLHTAGYEENCFKDSSRVPAAPQFLASPGNPPGTPPLSPPERGLWPLSASLPCHLGGLTAPVCYPRALLAAWGERAILGSVTRLWGQWILCPFI